MSAGPDGRPGDRAGPFRVCAASLIYEWTIDPDEWPPAGWEAGPYPFGEGDDKATAEERLTYFAEHTATALYGKTGRPVRFHRGPLRGACHDGFRPIAVELLALDFPTKRSNCLAVVHGAVGGPDEVGTLYRLVRPRPRGAALEWLCATGVGVGTPAYGKEYRGTSIVFATPRADEWPQKIPALRDWPTDMQWLRLLASCTPADRYTPHPEELVGYLERTYLLSSTWKALVLPEGLAFLALERDAGDPGSFLRSAELHVRSLYLDAILLGVAQELLLRELLRQVAALDDPLDKPAEFRQIEGRITRFRNIYWWQIVTPAEHANRLLELYAKENRLPALASHAMDETARFTEQLETRAAQQSNTALAILTVFGLPLGVAVGLEQALSWQPEWAWSVGALVIGAVIGFALWVFGVRRGFIERLRREKLKADKLQLPTDSHPHRKDSSAR